VVSETTQGHRVGVKAYRRGSIFFFEPSFPIPAIPRRPDLDRWSRRSRWRCHRRHRCNGYSPPVDIAPAAGGGKPVLTQTLVLTQMPARRIIDNGIMG
jgi:hypothetical protein